MGHGIEDKPEITRESGTARNIELTVRMNAVEHAMFCLYAHRQDKSIAAMFRSAAKSEIRRHKSRIEEFAELLEIDDAAVLDALRKE